MAIPISIQLYCLIFFSLGLLLTTIIVFLTFSYHRSRLVEILLFWGNFSLISFNNMFDMILLGTGIYSKIGSYGPVLATSSAFLLYITYTNLILKLKKSRTRRKLFISVGASLISISTYFITHWSRIGLIVRIILSSLLGVYFLYLTVSLFLYYMKSTIFQQKITKILSTILLSFLIYVILNDLINIFLHYFPLFPVFYGYLSIYFIFILNKTRKREPDITAYLANKYKLTRRESSIVKELIKGSTYKEVGLNLNISINTVRTHISKIYRKCDVKNKIELISLI